MGIYVANGLNFKYHVNQLLKKANKKLNALTRIFKYVETPKPRVFTNSFITL